MNSLSGFVPLRTWLLCVVLLYGVVRLPPTLTAENGYFDGRMWRISNGSAAQSQVAVDEDGILFISGLRLGTVREVFPNLSRWDGRAWQALVTNNVQFPVLSCVGRQLIGAGRFSRVGGVAATNIARWNAGRWDALGGGLPGGTVRTLAERDSRLYVGGILSRAGGLAVTNVACWDLVSETWSALGEGLPGEVSKLAVSPDGLYAGWTASGAVHVSSWTGSKWQTVASLTSPVGRGPAAVFDMIWHDDSLVIAGNFYQINGTGLTNLARLRNGIWEAVPNHASKNSPYHLAVSEGDLLVGFRTGNEFIPPPLSAAVMRLQSNRWEVALGPEAGEITALVAHGRELFAVGRLAGNTPVGSGVNPIYWQFDGDRWSPVNGGISQALVSEHLARHREGVVVAMQNVKALLFHDGTRLAEITNSPATRTLNVSGSAAVVSDGWTAHAPALQMIDGTLTNVIARLDGLTWTQATAPLPFGNAVIAFGGGRLFAAGHDRSRPGAASAVMDWNGSTWQSLGGEFDNPRVPFAATGLISSLAWLDGALYAGGSFTNVDSTPLANLARWSGITWEPVGEFNGPITGLEAAADGLHVIGSFSRVGDLAANRYARWDGHSWRTLAGGVPAQMIPSAVAVSDTGLIAVVGKSFAVDGGRLIFWRGGQWETPEPNTPNTRGDFWFNDAIWIGHDLYLAPNHPYVGPTESMGLAIWHENGPRLLPAPDPSALAIRVTGGTSPRFAVERSPDLLNWSPFATNALGNPGQKFRDPAPPDEGAFYRVRALE